MDSSIALVVAYFGTLPEMFPLWLKSAAYNATIDWFVFTDDRRPFDYPPNVKVHYLTFEEMHETAQGFFDFEISIPVPYRLCDFKPAYGEIFKDYLEGYDFWGYCDVDVMFGNIRSFMTEEILDEYPKILSRGHFTLMRNTPRMTALYRQELGGVRRYREVFTSDSLDLLGFDEWSGAGINDILAAHGIGMYDEMIFNDIYIGRHGFYPVQLMRSEPQKKNTVYVWDRGTLTRHYLEDGEPKSKDVLYIHLQKRKMALEPGVDSSDRILVVPNRFVPFNDGITDRDLLENLGRDRLIYRDYWQFRFRNLRRKIRRALTA